MVCPPVREIIHSLKFMDYLLIEANKLLITFHWVTSRLKLFPYERICSSGAQYVLQDKNNFDSATPSIETKNDATQSCHF